VSLDDAERVVRWLGAGLLVGAWAGSALGAARALGHEPGRALGVAKGRGALVAYLLAGGPYLVACVLLWRPLPLEPADGVRVACLALGGALGATGFGLYLWGRLALGDMYNVSSSLGSELFAGHRLVVAGPYRLVRHPMYLGIVLATAGALLVYRTWTTIFIVLALPGVVVKARHEDRLLAEELGGSFETYRACVRGWIPRVSARVDDTKRPRRIGKHVRLTGGGG
jgi:protein-S-isoprenylcysteine O-methyltransferase Ste14